MVDMSACPTPELQLAPVFRIHLERTFDYKLVRSIITEPLIYRNAGDDNSPAPERFQVVQHPNFWYVLAYDGDDLLGMFCLVSQSSVCWEVHTCLLPLASMVRGRTTAAARAFIQWVWKNTICYRLVTKVPACNRLALRFAERSGMVKFGRNLKSFLKYGELQDEIWLGISRPEGV